MRSTFRPDTGLDIYDSLEATIPSSRGLRSKESQFFSRWTVLNLKAGPSPSECCQARKCNPAAIDVLKPASKDDPRLHKYTNDFITLKIDRWRGTTQASTARPSSVLSNVSDAPLKRAKGTSAEEKKILAARLVEWRDTLCTSAYGRHVIPEMLLPDNVIKKVVEKCYLFTEEENRTREALTRVVAWDLALDEHFSGLLQELTKWSDEVNRLRVPDTPTRTQKTVKRAKADAPVSQPRTPLGDLSVNTSSSPDAVNFPPPLPRDQVSTSRLPVKTDSRYTPYPSMKQHGSPVAQRPAQASQGASEREIFYCHWILTIF